MATQHQALEYGCSVDPVVSLVHAQLRSKRAAADAAESWLLVVDQYGTLHPPSGVARAILVETGWDAIRVPIHAADGAVSARTAAELAPLAPRLAELIDASANGEANGGLTEAQQRAKASLAAGLT